MEYAIGFDGKPIRVGSHVWDNYDTVWVVRDPDDTGGYEVAMCVMQDRPFEKRPFEPKELSMESIDSWEKLWGDAWAHKAKVTEFKKRALKLSGKKWWER